MKILYCVCGWAIFFHSCNDFPGWAGTIFDSHRISSKSTTVTELLKLYPNINEFPLKKNVSNPKTK